MKTALITLCLMANFGTCIANAEEPFEDGLRPGQLAQIAKILPPTLISSIYLFHEQENGRISAIVLGMKRGVGWQMSLISPQGATGYKASWISEKLPESFAVSSPTNLSSYWLKNEQAIVFTGCAPHMCPEIFSALLFVPSRHRAFVGTCSNGQISYSFRTSDENVSEYKKALNETLREIDGHGDGHACLSEAKGDR